MNTPAPLPLYDPAYYDRDYYLAGARGGFRGGVYRYADPEQQRQLALKWQFAVEIPHESSLFVGCGMGFEVAYWLSKGVPKVWGVDVSDWATANAIPEARGRCMHYGGRDLNYWAGDELDLVLSFDVLPHLPDDMLADLAAEMTRVAKKGIVWRGIVKNWRNLDKRIDCRDGSFVTYRRLEFWDELFSRSGKFRLKWLKMHEQYEVTAIYERA